MPARERVAGLNTDDAVNAGVGQHLGQGWCRRGKCDEGLDAGVMMLMLQFLRRLHRIDIDLCRADSKYAKYHHEARTRDSVTAIRSPTRPARCQFAWRPQ